MSDCQACREIENNYPDFANQGVTDGICTNLRTDKGFKASDNKDDCYDLNLANDCLVGGMEEELKLAEVCDWATFTGDFIRNLHTMIKAVICAICGLWTAVKSYQLTKDGDYIELNAWDGSHGRVKVTSTDTKYQLRTKTYNKKNITVTAGHTEVIEMRVEQPDDTQDTLYPMAIAGWTFEGEGTSYLAVRYIQLIDRVSDPQVKMAVRNYGSSNATVEFMPEVLWWGYKTD